MFLRAQKLARSLKPALLMSLLSLSSCTSLHYYAQAISGHTKLMLQREPLEKVIEKLDMNSSVRDKLALTRNIRKYATDAGLQTGDAYATYVSTGEPYIVWNVFAAPEFSLSMKQFCFPIVGCTSYKGYFKQEDAAVAASRLRAEGYDVYVGGVSAYSTLGWFSDPILDSFLLRTDAQLAALLFHELAHRELYVKGDSQFNESFATSIERFLVERWLQEEGRSGELDILNAAWIRQHELLDLVNRTKHDLAEVYQNNRSEERKRQAKHDLLEELRKKYLVLHSGWQGSNDYYSWMMAEMNNAKLGTLSTYNHWVDSFNVILAQENFDLVSFIARVKELAKLDQVSRDRKLRELVEAN